MPKVLAYGAALTAAAMAAGRCSDWEPPPKPVSNWTIDDARAFDEFHVYWLGDTYEGLPLTSLGHSIDGDGVKHASFSYGEPSYYGDADSGSWLSPLEVDIQPFCGFSPKEFRSYYDDFESVDVRGVNGYVQRYDYGWNYVDLWSGTSAIHIGTHKTEFDIEQVAGDLIPIAEDSGARLTPLPPLIANSC